MRKRCFFIPMFLLLTAALVFSNVAKTLEPYIPPDAYEVHTPAEAAEIEAEDFVPTYNDVLDARERCLKGLTPEQISGLKNAVINANLYWEHHYMYDNIFGKLEDPDSASWNCLDPAVTGEYQTGWAYSGDLDIDAVCAGENLTEAEFYEKYATPVCSDAHYDTAGFITTMEMYSAAVSDESMKTDLQYLADELRSAVEHHSMAHANNMYKMLHDMDYFLLRYGLVDMEPYVPNRGFVKKYYGTLTVYN